MVLILRWEVRNEVHFWHMDITLGPMSKPGEYVYVVLFLNSVSYPTDL